MELRLVHIRSLKTLSVIFLICLLGISLCAETEVGDLLQYQQEGSGLLIFSGSADLPAGGFWGMDASRMEDFEGRVYVDADPGVWRQLQGDRIGEVILEERITEAGLSNSSAKPISHSPLV